MKQNWLNLTSKLFRLVPVIALFAFGCASQKPAATVQQSQAKPTDNYLVYTLSTKKTYLGNWTMGTNEVVTTVPILVKTKVSIAKDGKVESAEIIKSSGNPQFDQSVQQTLDRVQFVQPFAADATDERRTFVIDFELKPRSP